MTANKSGWTHTIYHHRKINRQWYLFLMIVIFSLVFAGCSDSHDGNDSSPDGAVISDNDDIELAKSALYTVYAGIGYSSADDLEEASLYNVMLDDLNLLAFNSGLLVLNNILSAKLTEFKEECGEDEDLCIITRFIAWMNNMNGSISFSNTDVDITIDITNKESGEIVNITDLLLSHQIRLHLTADFSSSSQFILPGDHDVTYSGSDNNIDFEAYLDGSAALGGSNGISINVQAVQIMAHDSLLAIYDTYDVQYQGWEISYEININSQDRRDYTNVFVVPEASYLLNLDTRTIRDNRDYSFKGEFVLNNETYETTGLHYVQKENDNSTLSITIAGDIRVPEVNFTVSVSSPDTIIRDSDGIWVAGRIDIMVYQDVLKAVLNDDGSATINSNESITAWQKVLNPLN